MTEQEVYYDFMQHWRWYKDHFGDNMDETFRAILKTFLAKYTVQYIIEELDKLVGYYEQPQDQFEMGFRQGIYRAKMKVEEILKKYKEKDK